MCGEAWYSIRSALLFPLWADPPEHVPLGLIGYRGNPIVPTPEAESLTADPLRVLNAHAPEDPSIRPTRPVVKRSMCARS
jgi:hypothetical protein